jgi:hypothetical protein
MTDRQSGDISISELRVLLALCQRLIVRSHPSAALMIDYAARDLEKSVATEQKRLDKTGVRPKKRLNANDGHRRPDRKGGGSGRRALANH